MSYHSLFEGKTIEVEFYPYHLLYNKRAWYVLGYSKLHESIRTFKLSRIKEFKVSDKCFVTEKGFDLQEYLGKAWSMIPEGKIYNIKLRFSAKVAKNVGEVQWHSTQKVRYGGDGTAAAEFRVDGLGEICWWILGYGDQVEVLAPKSLRNRAQKTAQNMVGLYNS